MLLHRTRCLLVWVLLDDVLKSAVTTLFPRRKDALLLHNDDAASYLFLSRSSNNNRGHLWVEAAEAPPPEATTVTTSKKEADDVPGSPTTTRNTIAQAPEATALDEADVPIGSLARGRELLLEGSFLEAATVLEEVVSTNGADPAALLFLAEAYQELGQLRKAVDLADQLLVLDTSTEAKSFVLNRRGVCLRRIGDLAGARESYELAVRYGGSENRHALYNLAHLLHYATFPRSPHNFSVLLHAVELYRGALGRRDSSASAPQPGGRHTSTISTQGERPESAADSEVIGGPVDIFPVYNDLAGALLQAGRYSEAAIELERALALVKGGTRGGGGGGNGVDGTPSEGARRHEAFLWDTLRRARDDAGDHFGAVAAAKKSAELVRDEPALYHNMGIALQKVGLLNEAEEAWLKAVELDPSTATAFASLGHLAGARGDIDRARKYYNASLAAAEDKELEESGRRHGVGGRDSILTAKFLVATAVIPFLYDSNDHIAQVRRDFEGGLDRLLSDPANEFLTVEHPSTTVGSGCLGYYILYQGLQDLPIRRKLARAYWRFAPSLRYCAPFLALEDDEFGATLRDRLPDIEPPGPAVAATRIGVVSGQSDTKKKHILSVTDLDEEAVSAIQSPDARVVASEIGTGEAEKPSSLSPREVLTAGTPSDPDRSPSDPGAISTSFGEDDDKSDEMIEELPIRSSVNGDHRGSSPPSCQGRLKVGFLSAYFFHHSVGLLTEGVITRLDRRRFESTAIFLQPHPTSASEEGARGHRGRGGGGGDDVYTAVRRGTENVLDLPASSPSACRHAIASLELDVLVFTEIGMNLESYFLSFARLARRSALFWGHAVTSGVSAFDATKFASGGGNTLRQVGGIDYFVSSWLFEDRELGRLAQRRYSERLYLMKGLTTYFARPPPPKPGLISRNLLDMTPLSSKSPPPGGDSTTATSASVGLHGKPSGALGCGGLYLVPQTLYKLHPDFDRLVAGVLEADQTGCVLFIRAGDAVMEERLARRMERVLSASSGVSSSERRVFFVPRLRFEEFAGLVEMADVVLDPFPVGGGRSSLEIFAAGTPIVMLYNRTSILQLTYGMYATMGLEGALADAGNFSDGYVSLVTYSEHQFINSAVAIATDADLNTRVRGLILSNGHRLYEQESVIAEWEEFLEGIATSPRPPPVENHGLAVDASNFPRNILWCAKGAENGNDQVDANLQRNNTGGDDGCGGSFIASNDNGITAGLHHHPLDNDVHPNNSTATSNSILDAEGDDAIIRADNALKGRAGLGPLQAPAMSAEAGAGLVGGTGSGGNPGDSKPGGLFPSTRGEFDETPRSNTLAKSSTVLGQSSHGAAELAAVLPQPRGSVPNIGSPALDVHPLEALLYEIEFSKEPDSEGGQIRRLKAEVYAGIDPMSVARQIKEQGSLDHLQYRWIGAVLCRGAGRLSRSVVWSQRVKIDDGPSRLLEVRQGDDLFQVARWHFRRHSLGQEGIPLLNDRLQQELPQHASSQWIASRALDRACQISSNSSSHQNGSRDAQHHLHVSEILGSAVLPAAATPHPDHDDVRRGGIPGTGRDVPVKGSRQDIAGSERVRGDDYDDGCITLAITTCKRVRGFLGTVQGLQALLGPLPRGDGKQRANPTGEANDGGARVCHVLVVDDGSSAEDRRLMMSSFPKFTYVFKGSEDEKEDDWWVINDNPPPPVSGIGNFLWRAMEVLRHSAEQVSQVLINDQSSNFCARGDTDTCTPEKQGTASGWPRTTPVTHDDSQFHEKTNKGCSRGSGTGESPLVSRGHEHSGGASATTADVASSDTTPIRNCTTARGGVEYRLHEFGVMYPSHQFSYWPGFSLNPALWDLRKLGDSYRRKYHRRFYFDPADIRFEQTMSMELFDAGTVVAHLPDVTFRHVGAGLSAYEANGMPRPWDRSSAQQASTS